MAPTSQRSTFWSYVRGPTIKDLHVEHEQPEPARPTLAQCMKLPSIRTGPLRVHTKSSSLFGKLMSAILPSHGLAIITAQHYYLFTSPNDLSAQCLASVPLLDAAVRQMAESFTFSVIDRTTRPEEQIDVSAADASDYHAWMDAIAQGSRSAREARREAVIHKIIVVQAIVRRHLAVKHYRRMRALMIALQSRYRGVRARHLYGLMMRRVVLVQSVVRRWMAQRLYMQMRLSNNIAKFQGYRTNVVTELRDTEASYVTDLETAIKVYLKPLRSLFPDSLAAPLARAMSPPTSPIGPASTPSPQGGRSKPSNKEKEHVTAEDIATIFGNIEDIHARHAPALEAMNELLRSWNETAAVSPLILEMTKWISSVYVPYCNNYDLAMETLERCRRNERFAKVLDTASGVKASKKLDVFGFLIMPIQRVPRYILLIKDLHKRTWNEHPDYAGLTHAIGELQRVTKQLNEAKRRDENRRKMAVLKNRFANLSGLAEVFADDVACVYEGPVESRIGDGASVKSYLLLFTDSLILSKRTTERNLDAKNRAFSKTYRFSDATVLPLAEAAASLAPLPKSTDTHGFSLSVNGKSYRFLTKSAAESDKWIKEIRATCAQPSPSS